jgi:hypothetical protein
VPRETYRDFFFYDDGKFIGIGTNNQSFMLEIENYQLVFVKATPSSSNNFGSGFTQSFFIPARGFMYTIQASGLMHSWFANNNATWGSPMSIKVADVFAYKTAALFNYNTLIAIDNEGYLWSIPISTTGLFRGLSKIGSGWDRFLGIMTLGNKLYALDGNGDYYEFDFNATDYYWVLN